MAAKANVNRGEEKYEFYNHPFKKGVKLCQYDYRFENGELFSCIAKSLDEARAKRDKHSIN